MARGFGQRTASRHGQADSGSAARKLARFPRDGAIIGRSLASPAAAAAPFGCATRSQTVSAFEEENRMDWIALLSGLVGVMIGSLTSIVTLLVQNYYPLNPNPRSFNDTHLPCPMTM